MPKTERYYSQQYSMVDNPAEHGTDLRTYSDYDEARQHVYESDDRSLQKPVRRPWWRRKAIIISCVSVALLLIIAIAVGLGVGLQHSDKAKPFQWTPSTANVTSETSFLLGGATMRNVNETDDGIGAGSDTYTYYRGNFTQFPDYKKWVSFSEMWKANYETLQTSCTVKNEENNSPEVIQQIYDAIQNISSVSYVDHRFVFAIVLQESHGCVRVKATDNGVRNPGLMQSHNGHGYDPKNSWLSILGMIQDGTQGTASGDGLVQNLIYYSSPYAAARGYNSGRVPENGELSTAEGATACYVSDVANRLTGWVLADSTCPGKS